MSDNLSTVSKLFLLSIFTLAFISLSVYLFPAAERQTVTTQAPPETRIIEAPFALSASLPAGNKPTDNADATSAAEAYEIFLQTGNARFLELAEKLIADAAKPEQPDRQSWLLRARIMQAKHQFAAAAADLENYLKTYPNDAYASLLAADAWRRAGQLDTAQKHCLSLAINGRTVESKLCLAEVMLSKADYQKASVLIESLWPVLSEMPDTIKRWCIVVKSDLLQLQGQSEQALALWNNIEDWQQLPYAYKLTLADLLISQSKPEQVLDLLNNERPALATLLRQYRAAALSHNTDNPFADLLQRKAYIVNHAPDKDLHLYERALYASWFDNDPQTALSLALQNWQTQKSYEDAQLVIQLAEKGGQTSAIKVITDWREQWQ